LPLAGFDAGLLEELAHLVVDCRRASSSTSVVVHAWHGLEVDAALRDSEVERDLARRVKRLAPHDRRRPHAADDVEGSCRADTCWGLRESTRTSACPNGRWNNISPP
jgi:hypothetical protein